jgi:hypothetical protein
VKGLDEWIWAAGRAGASYVSKDQFEWLDDIHAVGEHR